MKKRVLTLVLLLSIGFNVAHAYVIEALDTHPCHVSEYVHEFHNDTSAPTDDICHLHHFFHIVFLIPQIDFAVGDNYVPSQPLSETELYSYTPDTNFLKPPIFA